MYIYCVGKMETMYALYMYMTLCVHSVHCSLARWALPVPTNPIQSTAMTDYTS